MLMSNLSSSTENQAERLLLVERSLERAARLFEPYGQPDIDLFTNSLRDSDPAIRSLTVTVLGRVRDMRAAQLLINAMQQKDGAMTVRILEEFGKSGTEHSTNTLIKALRDGNPTIRTHAALALGQKGHIESVDPLISILVQGLVASPRASTAASPGMNSLISPYETREAARLLGRCKDARAVEPLIQLVLEHSQPGDKRDVLLLVRGLTSLGELADIRAAPAILGAIADTDADVRQAAVEAASKLAASKANPGISALYAGAIQTLGRELLVEEKTAKTNTIRALCALGDARALPLISAAVKKNSSLKLLLPIKETLFQPDDVWRQFPFDRSIKVADRVKILMGLRMLLSNNAGIRLLGSGVETALATNWIEIYARAHLTDALPESRACAQEVIDYVSLVRGSRKEDGAASGLLRAVTGTSGDKASGTLLRGAASVPEGEDPPVVPRGWIERLLAFFRR